MVNQEYGMDKGRGQKEGKRQRAEGRRKAKGRGQRAEGRGRVLSGVEARLLNARLTIARLIIHWATAIVARLIGQTIGN
jgi:hypothetical protein